ncbi:regulator [Aestuariirhabdus litorea]|uniref:Regulator n=2 Tax=Aestuariirhabdus litorea TaxID=2528527 RepID=A0A3P3VSA4_9GAMM|nr:regulator [Aestuariirhabdus litorea]RWW98730.1 regulator [Endozoicomonadaceae bacterium GTF-13]
MAVVIALLVSGCSEDRSEDDAGRVKAAAASYAVQETFNVGENVFVRSLAVEEESSSLWVGTSVGVNQISLTDFSLTNSFTRKDGLANEYVFAIGIDPDGYKWFGTNAGGMSRYKEEEPWRTFFPMHGLADYWIYSFANHPDGGLWIGTWAGVNRLDRNTLKMDTYVKELVNEWVYGLDVDSQGRVWFGTEGGVSRFDQVSGEWVSWTHQDGLGAENKDALPFSTNTGLGTRERHDLGVMAAGKETYNPNYVFALQVAEDQSVWVGTWGGGVSRFVDGRWSNYTVDDGLMGNIVYSLIQAKDGAFWFGTNRGISRFDGKNWQNFGRHQGLVNINVYALAESPSGDIWAGTRGSVVRIGQTAKEAP